MKKRESFLLKGHICYSNEQGKLLVKPDSYAVCREGICQGVFKEIPEAFADLPIRDTGDCLVIPGLRSPHPCTSVSLPGTRNGFGIAGLVKYPYISGRSQI